MATQKALACVAACFLFLLFFTISDTRRSLVQWPKVSVRPTKVNSSEPEPASAVVGSLDGKISALAALTATDENDEYRVDWSRHREVYSISRTDKKYFSVTWGDGVEGYNPNILSHPTRREQWVIVAQLGLNIYDYKANPQVIACTASFVDGALVCSHPPISLPIAHTRGCERDGFVGPHDPRIFYSPDAAYLLYGSLSPFSCHGMWVQDLRMLLHDFNTSDSTAQLFENPTDIQKPPPYGEVEKNYFLF